MFFAGLLLFAVSVPDESDAVSLAYTQCLFASSRAASAARLSADAFERRLATACIAEQRELERIAAKIFARRGDPDAAASAHRLGQSARQEIIANYRKALELEPQLKSVTEMCRAHPDQCRD